MSDAGHAGGPAAERGSLGLDERAELGRLRAYTHRRGLRISAVAVAALLIVLGLIGLPGSRPPARPATL
jgi:hypothetical protein